MALKLTDQRKADITRALMAFTSSEFEMELSEFRAEALIEFMLRQIGPSQYNQGIADAHRFMSEKLADLDTDFFEPEEL